MLPETPAVAAALSVAERHYEPAMRNHVVRTYAWATEYSAAHKIECDDELLCVTALLHDIALTPSFDSYAVPFEEAGGDLARVFGLAAGWPAERADRLAEVIVLHMRDDVSADDDPEAHVLQVATSWDVAGRWPEEFPADERAAMLARYPRLDFGERFLASFQAQARRKPASAAAASVGRNLAGRIAVHPLG
jgi:hypothetical protein